MHYIIYKITNKINGMIYIGKHTCKSIYDAYMGGCRPLWDDIERYGVENFEKIVLFECSNAEELDAKEAELVNKEFVQRSDTYNQRVGGYFGGNKINHDEHPEIVESNRKNANAYWNSLRSDESKMSHHRQLMKDAQKRIKARQDYPEITEKISVSLTKFYETHEGSFTGKSHNADTKKKLSISHKRFHELNGPTWNKDHHWYYHPDTKENKLLTPVDYELNYQHLGWKRGRWIFKEPMI